jgi:single-strand DNA-binding protein
MGDLNRVILCGRLGADPELKYLTSGQANLKIRMATTESYLDKDGERKERTDWHTVIVWGKRGEALNKILAKGSAVWVEGRLQTRSWEDKDGGKRYATDVVANDIGIMGGGKRDGGQRSGSRGGDEGGFTGHDGADTGAGDDDVPFAPRGDVG